MELILILFVVLIIGVLGSQFVARRRSTGLDRFLEGVNARTSSRIDHLFAAPFNKPFFPDTLTDATAASQTALQDLLKKIDELKSYCCRFEESLESELVSEIRLDYIAPDRAHLFKVSGNDVDEWVQVGDKFWSGAPLWGEVAGPSPHPLVTSFVLILNVLTTIIVKSLANHRFCVNEDGSRHYIFDGPFAGEKVPQIMTDDLQKIVIHFGPDGVVQLLDLEYARASTDENVAQLNRLTLNYFGINEDIVVEPPPWLNIDPDTRRVVGNTTIPFIPFHGEPA